MARVFISYARKDLALAGEVHKWLVEAGHEVFLDQDLRDGIAMGALWRARLQERLRWADAVVCVVTSASLGSTWCVAEIAIAQARGNRLLLPLLAEPDVAHPLLTEVQHTDLTQDLGAARAALIAALRQIDAAGGSGWPDDRSPFPGLRPFEFDRHRVFFGRAEEIKQLAELVRSTVEDAVLVVGPSGCGKSSLVRAGLARELAAEPGWRTLAPILPGTDPVAALARELAATARRIGQDWTVDHVRQQLDTHGLTALVDELLVADPRGPQRRLLIVVDQLEELLTQAPPDQRARFAQLLRPALTGPVQVVATLRPEFLDQLLTDVELADLPTKTYTLRPLHREALRLVIDGPARLAGLDVDEHLVARLVDDTDTGEALPLLAFTLAQLADGVSRGGQLSAVRYDQLGGVQGALTHQADAALKAAVTAGGRRREQVIAGLLRLVTVDEHGRPTRWRVHRAELPEPVVTELDAFVARRLVTTDADNGTVVIGVAHEKFLSAWPPLAKAITANVTALRARRAVEHAATEWHAGGRPPARLWGGGQLAGVVADTGARIRAGSGSPRREGMARWLPHRHRELVTDRVDLSPNAREFLRTSIRRDFFRRWRATTVLSVLLIVAVAAASVAVFQQRAAQEQQRIATARQLITRADTLRDTDPRTALLLGIAAEHIHPSGETRASLVNTLTTTRYAGTLTDHTARVTSVAFARDGPSTLATGDSDGIVILRDPADPARPRQLPKVHPSAVTSLAFSPDGRTLATGSLDGTAIVWDLSDQVQPRQALTVPTGPVSSMAFSPDVRTLATGGFDGTVTRWDLTNPVRPQRLESPGHAGVVLSMAFSPDPDARMLATGGSDGLSVLWDLADPAARPRQSLAGHTGTVNSVAFAPDGRMLATAGDDGTTRLWGVADPARPASLGSARPSHTSRVNSVAFAPDGRTLATASDDGTTRLWDLADPARPASLESALTSHTGRVTAVAFAPDGRTLATASSDRTVILWEVTARAQPRRLEQPLTEQPTSVESMMFAPNGHNLAVTSSNGTVIVWSLTDPAVWSLTDPARPRHEQPQTRPDQLVDSLALAPDGNTMVTASSDGTAMLWDLTDRSEPQSLGQTPPGHTALVTSAAFSGDGRTLATASSDGTVILWDLTNRRQPQPLGRPLAGHTALVTSAAFSGDGRTLATASDDGTAILWDLTDRSQPRRLGQPLAGHTGSVTSVALAPDGNILATGGTDATVILWDLTELNKLRDQVAAHACRAILGRSLTPDEWHRYIPGLLYQDTCPLIIAGTGGLR